MAILAQFFIRRVRQIKHKFSVTEDTVPPRDTTTLSLSGKDPRAKVAPMLHGPL
jgi:hypothetical protein